MGIISGLLELAVTVSFWFSLVAPDEMPVKATVWAGAFSLMATLPKAFNVGDWLTGLTVTLKFW